MRARRSVAALALVCVSTLGCSSRHVPRAHSSPTTPPTSVPPPLSLADAAAKYLQIATPADDALATMDRELNALPSTATPAEVAAIAEPGAAAVLGAVDQLAQVPWPVKVLATGDMKNFLVTANAVAGQLHAAGTQDATSLPAWTNELKQDSLKAKAASAVVRADLGLPPPP